MALLFLRIAFVVLSVVAIGAIVATGRCPRGILSALVGLLVTGRCPRSLFDLVLGLNRWCCASPSTRG